MIALLKPISNPRAVDVVRPLAIGAARFTTEFECLAPSHMNGAVVLSQLFKLYDFEACGWDDARTEIHDMGGRLDCRKWRVTKHG